MIGQTVSRYRILAKLGEGGMGVVYKAHDAELDRDVALKFLPHYLTSDPAEKERFYHEARTAAALTHQNIAVVHEIGEYENQLFIAMEYVEGKTLKQLVESQVLSVMKTLDIAIQVCDGLAAAHEKGIVHRDIKSDNIIATTRAQAKIMDFGLAKVKGAAKLTKTGSTLGTAAYMSPEQARGEEVDHRSDIFSFGVVLYELLTGKLPFAGEHQAALMYSIINEDPKPVARFNGEVTPELEHIVMKALAKDKDERYQHADDLLADLRHERKGLEYAKSGYVRAQAVERPAVERGPARGTGKLPRYLTPTTIVVVAVALVVIFNPFNFRIGTSQASADRKSVAVLPFTNMSGNEEDEFFSDGVTEDIIAQLSNIADLKVISRTSVTQYKDTKKSLREIGRELNVATVLEGSVRRAGRQVRIVAQLVDAANDEHLWAQTYDKELTQVFAIQSDVARQIAAALEAELTPRENEQLAKKPTENLDAYVYYLKGREYYYRYSKRDNENAIELFKRALELDPHYALAYAGLSDSYAQRADQFGFQQVWTDSSIAVGNKAVSIDPNLAEGYKALGLAYGTKGWIRRSLEAYRKAIDINPNYHPAAGNIGYLNTTVGNFDEALRWQKKALALNPMIAYSHLGVGYAYLALGEDAKVVECCNKALTLQPDLLPAYFELGAMHLLRGEPRQALDQAKKILSLQADDVGGLFVAGIAAGSLGDFQQAEQYMEKFVTIDPTSRDAGYGYAYLGYVYQKTGREALARKLFERDEKIALRELERGNEYPDIPYVLALINAMRGNRTEAYRWLEMAIDAGWVDYRRAETDRPLESIRGEERFKQMTADMKARVDEMRKRVEEMEEE